jgi:hypothetical protein
MTKKQLAEKLFELAMYFQNRPDDAVKAILKELKKKR